MPYFSTEEQMFSLCLSVYKITQTAVDECSWNFLEDRPWDKEQWTII